MICVQVVGLSDDGCGVFYVTYLLVTVEMHRLKKLSRALD